MLSAGDGIALVGACAVIITALIKLRPKKDETNGLNKTFVRKETCDAVVVGLNKQLKLVQQMLSNLDNKFDDLNKFMRNSTAK